jgi:hypothetical protein
MNKRRYWLWRAVDQDGTGLDILVQSRRDQHAAERFLHRALDAEDGVEPRVIVTNELASYAIRPSSSWTRTVTPSGARRSTNTAFPLNRGGPSLSRPGLPSRARAAGKEILIHGLPKHPCSRRTGGCRGYDRPGTRGRRVQCAGSGTYVQVTVAPTVVRAARGLTTVHAASATMAIGAAGQILAQTEGYFAEEGLAIDR